MTLASLAALVREIQADREPVPLTAAVVAVRNELGETREQLLALQDEVSTVTEDREAAVGMCHQMQLSIADLEEHGGSEEDSPRTPVRRTGETEYFAAWHKPERPDSVDHHRRESGGVRHRAHRNAGPAEGPVSYTHLTLPTTPYV